MTAQLSTPPPSRDRMPGRYFIQCPRCRTHRLVGPDCPAGDAPGPRYRRRVEKQQLQRWLNAKA